MITFLVALGALQTGLHISSIKALPDPPEMRRLEESRVQGGTGTGYSVGYVFGTFKGELKNFAEVWTPDDRAVMLPMPPGATHAFLSGVNSKGLAVGQYQAKRGEQLLVWDAATGKVQTPPLGERGCGYAVNDSGVIVGVHMARARGHFIAFRYHDGKLQELKPIEPLKNSLAMAVNEEGVAVGNSFTDSRRATLWDAAGNAKAIPLLDGTTVSEAAAINDKGVVVGTCSNADGSAGRGFFYGPEGLTELAGLGVGCSPLSINNLNQVVGKARLTADAFENVGFVNWNGKSVDLNTLLPRDSGWKITEATHITDDGRVFGNGYLNGRRRAFTLQISTSGGVAATPPANKLDSLRSSFLTAFNRGDATAMEAIFEPDVLLLSFTGQPVHGGAMIAKVMAGMSKELDLDMQPLQSRESGDLLYEAGTWSHLDKASKAVRQSGTYVWIWMKEKDTWRIETMSVTQQPRA